MDACPTGSCHKNILWWMHRKDALVSPPVHKMLQVEKGTGEHMTDKTMTLEPCPFCGGEAEITWKTCDLPGFDGKSWSASCRGDVDEDCFASTFAQFKKREYAIQAWNKRTRHISQTAERATHPDDIAVDQFAAAMKSKLAEARSKGRGGWQDKEACPQQLLSNMLLAHVDKGDPRDVANFCMFLHQRGESILTAERGEAVATRSMPPDRDEAVAASLALGSWMSAALDDPSVCAEMKRDINRWFDAAMPSAPPPAAGVPDALPEDPDENAHGKGRIRGWNECRSAMLSTTPSSAIDVAAVRRVHELLEIEGEHDIADKLARAIGDAK